MNLKFKNMHNYELTCLISANLSESELKFSQEKIIALLQKEEGIFITRALARGEDERSSSPTENQGKIFKKNLASPIKKQTQAYLIVFNFQLNPAALENFKKNLMKDENILRCTILAKKPVKLTKIPERLIKTIKKTHQPKVELKEIEKKLEEILGE